MWIKTKDGKQLWNTTHADNKIAILKLGKTFSVILNISGQNVHFLGKYTSRKYAETILNMIFDALAEGRTVFKMPPSDLVETDDGYESKGVENNVD